MRHSSSPPRCRSLDLNLCHCLIFVFIFIFIFIFIFVFYPYLYLCVCAEFVSGQVTHDWRMPVFLLDFATGTFWTKVHTVESSQDAAGLLSLGPRALARHRVSSATGKGQDRPPRMKVLCLLRSCGVSAPLTRPAFFFCCWSEYSNFRLFWCGQFGALQHVISSAATCKLLRTLERKQSPAMDHCSGAKSWPMGATATQHELSAAIQAIEGARSVVRFDSVCF